MQELPSPRLLTLPSKQLPRRILLVSILVTVVIVTFIVVILDSVLALDGLPLARRLPVVPPPAAAACIYPPAHGTA